MKTTIRPILTLLAFILVAPGSASAQEEVAPEIQYAQVNGRWVVRLSFVKGPKKKVALRVLDQKQGEPLKETSYELKAKDKVINLKVLPATELGLLSKVYLEPASPLNAEEHTLTIKEGKLFVLQGAETKALKETTLKLSKEQIERSKKHFERDEAFIKRNSIELSGGSPGGVATIRVSLQRDSLGGLDWANLRLNGSADLTLDPDDQSEFFNSISGELDLYAPILIGENSANPRYSELSLHARTESDQEFQVTDGVVGLRFGIYPKDPVTRWVGTLFVPTNNHAGALIFVGYDYVQNLAGDAEANAAATGIDTERADHRLSALLRWRVPLLENSDFSFIPALGGRYNVDLDLELKGVYDINADRFLDQSRISLQFTRVNEDRFKPAFVFTWARGKEAPTWQEVNALLAGLKLSF